MEGCLNEGQKKSAFFRSGSGSGKLWNQIRAVLLTRALVDRSDLSG